MSLMAELGEGPPPEAVKAETAVTAPRKTSFNIFEAQMAPRPLMAPPPMPTPTMQCINGMAPPPWQVAAQNMGWQPGPPGIMPPPPPPGASSPPQMMQWMSANNQPPPPGAGAGNGSMTWQPAAFPWPPATACPPPPPPGIDVTLLTTPPPPPPS